MTRPPRAQGSIAIVSSTNILIHTPGLERVSALLPWWAVSTADHIEHHRKLTKFYGAPTLSVDRLLACVVGKPPPPPIALPPPVFTPASATLQASPPRGAKSSRRSDY